MKHSRCIEQNLVLCYAAPFWVIEPAELDRLDTAFSMALQIPKCKQPFDRNAFWIWADHIKRILAIS